MGGVEISLLVVAAVILAVNQGLRDSPAIAGRFGFLRPKGWWNYVPLGLVVLAGIVWLVAPSGDAPEDATGSVAVTGVPLSAIGGAFKERTHAEAARIASAYAERPATITGEVQDVRQTEVVDESFTIVALKRADYDDYGVVLTFEDAESESASLFRRGETITARCDFDAGSTDALSASFENCRLIDGPHPASRPS